MNNNPKQQKKLALSMRGGGVRTASYIGVLKALEENNIRIDMLVGSSGGAIIAAGYAAGLNLDDISYAFGRISLRNYIGPRSIKGLSIISNKRAVNWINKFVNNINIEDTKIKLWIQASNLDTYKLDYLEKGNLAEAVIASCAAPIIFQPMLFNGFYYTDGDLMSGYGVDFLKSHGAEIVVGLNCKGGDNPRRRHKLIHNRIREPYAISTRTIQELDQKLSPVDFMIGDLGDTTPILKGAASLKLIDKAYKKTLKLIPQLQKILF